MDQKTKKLDPTPDHDDQVTNNNQQSNLNQNDLQLSYVNQNNTNSGISLKDIDYESLENACYGCVFGAGIGDSIGSYLEFTGGTDVPDRLDYIMSMPGGGTWGTRVKTGQVTDDTELAVSLSRGLVNLIDHQNNNNNTNDNNNTIHHIYDSYYIAVQYEKWYASGPFDIGGCTSSTLSESPSVSKMKQAAFDYDIMMKNQYKGSGNLANGSLMRCTPLIVYSHKLDYKSLYDIMSEDSSLTHSNPIVYHINTSYAIAIQYLLHSFKLNDNDNDNTDLKQNDNGNRNTIAFSKAENWLKSQIKSYPEAEQVYEWLLDCKKNNISVLYPATKTIGFLRIAFQRAFYHLYNGSSFEISIRETVSEGGDTDTNGAIVGGLLGAYHGLNGIPNVYYRNMINCIPAKPKRDNAFQTKLYKTAGIIKKLIKYAPNTIQIKEYEKPKYNNIFDDYYDDNDSDYQPDNDDNNDNDANDNNDNNDNDNGSVSLTPPASIDDLNHPLPPTTTYYQPIYEKK